VANSVPATLAASLGEKILRKKDGAGTPSQKKNLGSRSPRKGGGKKKHRNDREQQGGKLSLSILLWGGKGLVNVQPELTAREFHDGER